MFTPRMEFGFAQCINIYRPDEKSFIRFMMASQDEADCIRMVLKQKSLWNGLCLDFNQEELSLFYLLGLFSADVSVLGDDQKCCHAEDAAAHVKSGHAPSLLKWKLMSRFNQRWTRYTLLYIWLLCETVARQQAEVQWTRSNDILLATF